MDRNRCTSFVMSRTASICACTPPTPDRPLIISLPARVTFEKVRCQLACASSLVIVIQGFARDLYLQGRVCKGTMSIGLSSLVIVIPVFARDPYLQGQVFKTMMSNVCSIFLQTFFLPQKVEKYTRRAVGIDTTYIQTSSQRPSAMTTLGQPNKSDSFLSVSPHTYSVLTCCRCLGSGSCWGPGH